MINLKLADSLAALSGAILSEVQQGTNGSFGQASCRVQAVRPTLADLMAKNSLARSELQSFKAQLMASIKSEADPKPNWTPLADPPAAEVAAARPREASTRTRRVATLMWVGRE